MIDAINDMKANDMFAIAENSNDPTFTTNDHFGDIRFISDKFVTQIGFNSAYGGTPLDFIREEWLADAA